MSSSGVNDDWDIILVGSKAISSKTLIKLFISFPRFVEARGQVDIDIGMALRLVVFPNPKNDFTDSTFAKSVKTRIFNNYNG